MAWSKDALGYQYYNALFQYNLLENTWWTNLYFKDIINSTPVISPYEQIWFKTWLDYDRKWDDWDFWQFYMDQRLWVSLLSDLWAWAFITDMTTYEWNTYVMYKRKLDPSKDDWTIGIKRINSATNIWCWTYNNQIDCFDIWCTLVEIASSECAHDKFLKVMWPKWKVSTWFQARIRNTLIWNSVVWEIQLLWWWSVTWNVFYVSSAENKSVAVGIMRLKWYDQDNTTYVNSTWILPETDKRYDVIVVSANEYGTILWYVDGNWIQLIPDPDCSMWLVDRIPIWSIFWTKYAISSVVKRWDWSAFLTRWSVFFSQWWFNLWSYTYSLDIWDQYTHLIKMQQYVIAIWPNNIWVIYKAWLDSNWIVIPKFEEITDEIGYFNPYSWQYRFRSWYESFFLFNSDSELWKYDIQVSSDNLGNIQFSLTGIEFWRHYISRYMKMLRREKWDHVEMYDNGKWMQIFITDSNIWEERNTIIINYNEKYKFWHTWMFCDITLRNRYNNMYYWNKIRCYWWNKDNGEFIKQYFSLTFWDATIRTAKNIASIWILFWYNSLVTNENTRMDIRLDLSWRSMEHNVYDIFWINYFNELYLWRKNNTTWKLLKETISWTGIYWGNWLSNTVEYLNLDKAVETYCWYKNSWINWDDNDCFDKHAKFLKDDEWCDVRHIESDKPEQDTDYHFHEEIAKFAWWYAKVNLPCDLLTVELMCKEWDRLHIGWLNIWYELIDTELTWSLNIIVAQTNWYWKKNNSC